METIYVRTVNNVNQLREHISHYMWQLSSNARYTYFVCELDQHVLFSQIDTPPAAYPAIVVLGQGTGLYNTGFACGPYLGRLSSPMFGTPVITHVWDAGHHPCLGRRSSPMFGTPVITHVWDACNHSSIMCR